MVTHIISFLLKYNSYSFFVLCILTIFLIDFLANGAIIKWNHRRNPNEKTFLIITKLTLILLLCSCDISSLLGSIGEKPEDIDPEHGKDNVGYVELAIGVSSAEGEFFDGIFCVCHRRALCHRSLLRSTSYVLCGLFEWRTVFHISDITLIINSDVILSKSTNWKLNFTYFVLFKGSGTFTFARSFLFCIAQFRIF